MAPLDRVSRPRQPSVRGPAEHLVTAQRRFWSSRSRIRLRTLHASRGSQSQPTSVESSRHQNGHRSRRPQSVPCSGLTASPTQIVLVPSGTSRVPNRVLRSHRRCRARVRIGSLPLARVIGSIVVMTQRSHTIVEPGHLATSQARYQSQGVCGVVRVLLLRCGVRHRPGSRSGSGSASRRPSAGQLAGRWARGRRLIPVAEAGRSGLRREHPSEHRARHSRAHGLAADGTGLPIASRGYWS